MIGTHGRGGMSGSLIGERPTRSAPFSLGMLPREQVRIAGTGQGRMREMLSFAAKRTETLVWSWDEGELVLSTTNADMVHGRVEALEVFGIGDGWRIEETDLPLSFRVTDPSGTTRTIAFRWDGSQDDMMSLEPHVKRWNPTVRSIVVVAGGAALWWGILAMIGVV